MLSFNENSVLTFKGIQDLSPSQEEILTKCYLPIIGNECFSLYHVIIFNQEQNVTINDLLTSLDLTIVKFTQNIHKLEAIGLLGTYLKQTPSKDIIIIKAFRPLNAQEFFKNAVLLSLLEKKLGNRKVRELSNEFKKDNLIPQDFSDVSSNFEDVFSDDIQLNELKEISSNLKSNDDLNNNNLNFKFDKEEFKKELINLQVDPESLVSFLPEIERISSIYGINSKLASEFVVNDGLNSYGEFSIDYFEKIVSNYHHYKLEDDIKENKDVFGDSDYAKRIKLMNSLPPIIYLENLMQADIPSSYRKLIDNLSKTYCCSNSLINCILDYTFLKCNGELPNQYVYKTVISLHSQGIDNGEDAFSYLYQRNSKVNKKIKKNNEEIKVTPSNEESKQEDLSKVDEDDVDLSNLLGDKI